MACFLYSLILKIETLPAGLTGPLKTLSACSFGVYLIHPVLIDTLRSRHIDLTQYSALWLFPLCFACFLLAAFGLSWLLLKIPGLKKLVS